MCLNIDKSAGGTQSPRDKPTERLVPMKKILLTAFAVLMVAFTAITTPAFGQDKSSEEDEPVVMTERLKALLERKKAARESGQIPTAKEKTPEELAAAEAEKKAKEALAAQTDAEKALVQIRGMKVGETRFVMPYWILVDAERKPAITSTARVYEERVSDDRYRVDAIPVSVEVEKDPVTKAEVELLVFDLENCHWQWSSVPTVGEAFRFPTLSGDKMHINFVPQPYELERKLRFRVNGKLVDRVPPDRFKMRIWEGEEGEDYWVSVRYIHTGYFDYMSKPRRTWIDGWAPISLTPFEDELGPAAFIRLRHSRKDATYTSCRLVDLDLTGTKTRVNEVNWTFTTNTVSGVPISMLYAKNADGSRVVAPQHLIVMKMVNNTILPRPSDTEASNKPIGD